MTEDNIVELKDPAPSKDLLQELIRAGARRLLAEALEAEVADLLEKYANVKTTEGHFAIVRNGYQPERELQTGIGPITVRVPKVRAKMGEPITFRSALVPPYVRKTRSLEAALPWLYLKGISTGEMSEALAVLVGPEATGLSASTISRLKVDWGIEYKAWRERDFSGEHYVYIWVDGVYSGLRGDDNKLCALVVIGVTECGEKHFLAIEDGQRESTQSWREVLLSLKSRGLVAPELAVGDGAMGFWSALEEVYPDTKQQRCWMHKTGNILNYLPKLSQPKAKSMLHEIWQAETRCDAEKAFDLFIQTYEAKYPKATNCLIKDRSELLTFYDFPAEHWQSIRTSNVIESSFGTIRHRTKRSKGCLSRDGMLHMIYKLGMCAEKNWNRIRGSQKLAEVVTGVRFKDGIKVTSDDRIAA
jgi:putative transposase